jgi:hypothetical protein
VNSKHPLGQLIEKVQRDNGWSDRDLAARAQSMELDLGKSNWSRLKNQPVLTFKPSHIKGLALVLKQTETTVARAALASMGIDLEGYQDGDVKAAVRNNAELSERDKRVLLAVYRELSEHPEPALDEDLAQNMLGLAAHTGNRRIGPDDLPYE